MKASIGGALIGVGSVQLIGALLFYSGDRRLVTSFLALLATIIGLMIALDSYIVMKDTTRRLHADHHNHSEL